MPLKVSTEPKENRQLEMTIEVEQERVDQELRKAARKLAGQYRIPGFRKGKAPYHIVAQYVGLPALFNEFIEKLGEEVYRQALEQEQIEPYAPASLDIASLEPLTYRLTIPLEPKVDLGDYRSLRLEEEEPVVEEAEIEEQLKQYLEQYAGWQEVDRPSQYGDMLTIDVKSVLVQEDAAEGEETVVLDETDWDVTLDQENPMEPPGFDEALLGMRPGEEKEFVLSWPEDSQSIYAGKQARFHVKLHKIQAYEQPELNDDFAKLVGPDFETLDDLKESIRQSLLEEKKREAEQEYLEKALDLLVEQSQMEYPPVVVEDQLDAMVQEFERQLRQFGIESLESYLQQTGQSLEEYRESLREAAERVARRNLVISELYQAEGLEVTDEDIEERIKEMFGEEADSQDPSTQGLIQIMRQGAGRSILESQILQEKALQRLLAIVRGEELPPPGQKEDGQESTEEGEPAEQASAEATPEASAGGSDEENASEASEHAPVASNETPDETSEEAPEQQ
ncbi:trigger factor [Litorilinea aerophila]|uniref:Trigger factor n=1 Tax=Litorilinea aerophila TaxID=1204385 RepID=A0A540VDW1_9CHLR|nr:trigger factor [Litorilinea aerophila]MCC9077261.1 trigger factor [Litorilinea aerophila]